MNSIKFQAASFARASAIVTVTALSMGLAACDKAQESPTVGQRIDSAIQKTDQAATDARIKAEQALQTNEINLDARTANASASVKEAANSASDFAADAAITAKVSAELAKDSELSAIKIDVDTQAGAVRLSGPAPTQAAKERASTLAQSVEGVLSVDNALVVSKG